MPGKPILLSKLPKKASNMGLDKQKAAVKAKAKAQPVQLSGVTSGPPPELVEAMKKGAVVHVMGTDIPFEAFKTAFYETAQAQYNTATANIKAMPPALEAEMKKTLGVTKEGLLKHAEQFNPAGHGKKGK
jgi:hypothetical protein